MPFPTEHRSISLRQSKKRDGVINITRAKKGDPSVWKEVYEWGKQIAAQFDNEPSVPRTTGMQQHRENFPATT